MGSTKRERSEKTYMGSVMRKVEAFDVRQLVFKQSDSDRVHADGVKGSSIQIQFIQDE